MAWLKSTALLLFWFSKEIDIMNRIHIIGYYAGSIEIALPDGKLKRIGITRAHLEEDAGD